MYIPKRNDAQMDDSIDLEPIPNVLSLGLEPFELASAT